MEREKSVDEAWKQNIESEKELLESGTAEENNAAGDDQAAEDIQFNFMNYTSSMVFQAMIFLGELPNPMADNQMDQNLPQAKFLIDTLALLREKTKGNLTQDEETFLNASIYELQMKYVEHSKKASSPQAPPS